MKKQSRTRIIAIAAIVAAGFFVCVRVGWLRPITDPLTRVAIAVAAPAYRVSAAIGSLGDAAAGAQAAPGELESLRTENIRLRALVSENQSLKDSLLYKDRAKEPLISARVVSLTSAELFHGYVIDRGTDDGIRPGQPVVAGDGVIVGKVESATPLTAAVMALTDPRSRLAVALQDADGTLGVLQGDRGISISVTLIPLQEAVTPGDSVVTSGLEPGIPRGLAVGTIDKVSRSAQDPFQTALVTPLAAAARPMFVQVLLTPVTE